MRPTRPESILKLFGITLLLSFLMVACSSSTPLPATSEPTALPNPTLKPADTASPQPTADVVNPTVILVSSQAGVSDSAAIRTALGELAGPAGLDLRVVETLTDAELDSSVRVVVILPPNPGVAEMAGAHPDIQFVGVNLPGVDPLPNLSLIGPNGAAPAEQAFLAGYIAALLTPDWRAGILVPGDEGANPTVVQAFENGVRFFCGLCKPAYPPFLSYPQSAPVPNPMDPASWSSAIGTLSAAEIESIYVADSVSVEYLESLQAGGARWITTAPPSELTPDRWIATFSADPIPALKQLWPDILAGKGGARINLPLVVNPAEGGLLTEAKMRLVDDIVLRLSTGEIDPLPLIQPES